jgi:taurine dioxygenase
MPRSSSRSRRRLGPPQPHVIDQFHHPDDPNILILSNVRNKDGKPTGLQDAGSYFHTDYSYLAGAGARDDALLARCAEARRRTRCSPTRAAAYDDLPQAMKDRIEPLLAIHHYGNRNDVDETSRTVASVLTDAQKAKMPLITHRIARPHPVTGRKALYAVSGSSFGIVGMPDDEARDLLDELAAHSTAARYQMRFRYGIGDIVVWDNAALLHSATLTDPDDARTLWRITVLEPAPEAAAPAVLARPSQRSSHDPTHRIPLGAAVRARARARPARPLGARGGGPAVRRAPDRPGRPEERPLSRTAAVRPGAGARGGRRGNVRIGRDRPPRRRALAGADARRWPRARARPHLDVRRAQLDRAADHDAQLHGPAAGRRARRREGSARDGRRLDRHPPRQPRQVSSATASISSPIASPPPTC